MLIFLLPPLLAATDFQLIVVEGVSQEMGTGSLWEIICQKVQFENCTDITFDCSANYIINPFLLNMSLNSPLWLPALHNYIINPLLPNMSSNQHYRVRGEHITTLLLWWRFALTVSEPTDPCSERGSTGWVGGHLEGESQWQPHQQEEVCRQGKHHGI